MWNLEKWFQRIYLQGRNRDAGIGDRYVEWGWGGGGMDW